ncbi:MAG: hypothetical protein SGPRY_000604, partial [Prymnesium sp.]
MQERLSQLRELLQSQADELRSQTAGLSSEESGTSHASVELRSPWRLQSAYGMNSIPTHVLPQYHNALDWICYDEGHLRLRQELVSAPAIIIAPFALPLVCSSSCLNTPCAAQVAVLPSLDDYTAQTAMPSTEFPSDHVSLCADLTWVQPKT